MNFSECYTLEMYSKEAETQFNRMQSRLSDIGNSFQTKMNGKTSGAMAGSLVGTILWIAAFIVGIILIRNTVNSVVLVVASLIVLALMAVMIIDAIMDFSYYGKILSYSNSVSQLQNRVTMGKNMIMSNHEAFMGSKRSGWNYLLNAAPSIPEAATSVVSTVEGLESLKKGFLENAKTALYYVASVAVTIVGGLALFPATTSIINGISRSLSYGTIEVISYIALIIVCVGEVILAKLMWSKTDCTVTNTTLFALLAGPIGFVVLVAVAALVVVLVVATVSILLAILAVVAVIAIIIGCTSGGS